MTSLREKAGAVLYDWIPFEFRLRQRWIEIRNRRDRIEVSKEGVWCNWRWTSDLHLCKVFPSTGRRLLRRAFEDWPVALGDTLAEVESPRVSFIIGHRGMERLPHLLATIASIAGQRDTSVECIVVEQAQQPEVRDVLPKGVRYVQTPVPASLPYCRSAAFNAGARIARSDVLVLHDNDAVVPRHYAKAASDAIAAGYDFANLIRFVFHMRTARVSFDEPPTNVIQNTQGLSVIAQRHAYLEIGGYDESFVGWGGEDNDFWDRASTRRVQKYGSVPVIHLWHAPQPEKNIGDQAPAVARYRELEKVPPEERIARLTGRQPN